MIGLQCDFCDSRVVRWRYPARSFPMPNGVPAGKESGLTMVYDNPKCAAEAERLVREFSRDQLAQEARRGEAVTVDKVGVLSAENVNNNCDGSGPHASGEVRILPYGGGGNLILCRWCFEREIHWRKGRNHYLQAHAFDLPAWHDLEVYEGAL